MFKRRTFLCLDNLGLEKFDLLLESTLLNYVKYSSRLKLGSELRQNECLISSDGTYRLSLDNQGRLLLYLDSTRLKYLFLHDNVESLWFYDLAILVCLNCSPKLSVSRLFPDANSAGLVLQHLSRMAAFKHSTRLKLTNHGTIEIAARMYEYKLIIQFREDVKSMWNAPEARSECICYLERNIRNHVDNDEDENFEFDDTSSDEEDSSTDSETSN